LSIKAEKRLKEFSALCKILGVGQLDNSLLDWAADIYRQLKENMKTVEDADILTAVFCKNHDFFLVTHNVKHFEIISGLRCCDWV
jgi:predicted nucleic acid-binding protein